ncbi:MAG: N-6 DNA methylase, partial [Planctomycetaceae bacterium]|nr:N-6 DNA methylase [Planctomycetaceae bacterium]
MVKNIHERENERRILQDQLDSGKTTLQRNQLGQFATPPALAEGIVRFALEYVENGSEVRFFDPAFGTGAFYSAFLRSVNGNQYSATGIEIDSYYGKPAEKIWKETGLQLHLNDFTEMAPPTSEQDKFDCLICNPPYVRHHHIDADKKASLKNKLQTKGLSISGLAGLYCYFLLLADDWIKDNGISIWLIPNEFMDVNYGKTIKEYLVSRVELIRIHRFEPENVQFGDALVSSTIVVFRKKKPNEEAEISFSFGGSLQNPKQLQKVPLSTLNPAEKWSRFSQSRRSSVQNHFTLGDLFTIKRGIATGNNDYFILSKEQIREYGLTYDFLIPILPSPRFLTESIIETDAKGHPRIDKKLFLIDCNRTSDELKDKFSALWHYLRQGIEKGIPEGYICAHRTPWYSQEQRPAALFVCAYIGRNSDHKTHPFRFILNRSKATVTNSWLVFYPTPLLKEILQRKHDLDIEILH